MAGSASGQDEANSVYWLPSGQGGPTVSCPLGIARFVSAKATFFGVIVWPYNSFIDHACGKDGWLLASFFILRFMEELGQYPAILTSRLVNNAYILDLESSIRGVAVNNLFLCLFVCLFIYN